MFRGSSLHWTHWAALTACAALSACSSDSPKHRPDSLAYHMIYSPNGEPLNGDPLGQPTCQDAISGWFKRVDANHNGSISLDEFLADAQMQFKRMDIDANGYLVSEEVERFRQPYRQMAANYELAAEPVKNDPRQKQEGKHRHGSPGGQSDSGSRQTITSADSSDPVMSADTNLDFKVTLDEFLAHARQVFSDLDANHDGSLSRDEALAQCKPKP